MAWNAFCQSLSSNAFIGIQSEAYDGKGLKGRLRLLRSKYNALQFREQVDFILGIGTLGVDWFKSSGYLNHTAFPFGYFVETPLLQNDYSSQETLSSRAFDLIFVGQLIPRKGWDILLRALSGLKSLEWRLHVVGDGQDRSKFVRLCAKLGLTDSIHLYGTLPNAEAIHLVSKSDLLVLPSRWDGWGAVVNEALMCGVPVVCSNRCGAADLLDGHERGEVFSPGSPLALRATLDRRISQGKRDAARSERIREWSKCIDGESAARYFMEIVKASITGGNKPIAPWFKK
jgi:glycosyltransferase involved in cell wall biosynthesis